MMGKKWIWPSGFVCVSCAHDSSPREISYPLRMQGVWRSQWGQVIASHTSASARKHAASSSRSFTHMPCSVATRGREGPLSAV